MAQVILHIMNYAASYRGNFIDSLENLDSKIQKDGMENYYLFNAEADNEKSRVWIDELIAGGKKVRFLTGVIQKDAGIIKSILKEEKVVLVHTHFISMQQYLSVYLATFAGKIPIVMHMHNHSQEAKNPLKRELRRFLYGKCNMVACSDSVLKSLERDYPGNKKDAIDNGVNFARMENYKALTGAEYDVADYEKVFLIFGFDFYRKGVDLAVRAIDMLQKRGKKYALLISLSTNFEEVEKNIKEILGEVPDWVKIIPARNDVATLYNFVDLFLSPSREEGLPYSVVEAGYSKCGVVMSDISAQKYLKVPYGVWFRDGDINELAEKIELALEQHEEKVTNWDKVKVQMQEAYALDSWSNQMQAYYKKVLE